MTFWLGGNYEKSHIHFDKSVDQPSSRAVACSPKWWSGKLLTYIHWISTSVFLRVQIDYVDHVFVLDRGSFITGYDVRGVNYCIQVRGYGPSTFALYFSCRTLACFS